MTTGEGIAVGVGALLLGGLVYLGASKLGAGADTTQAQAAAAAQAAIAAERDRLALQLQAQQAARPTSQAGNTLNAVAQAAPGLIDLGLKLFGALGSR